MMENNNNWTDNIKNFLNKKIQEEGLSVSQLAKLTDIPGTTMREMLNNRRPEIKNIVKIADYFNCSIDEILFNKPPSSRKNHNAEPTYNKLSLKELNTNLKKFVQDKLKENNINQYNLGKTIGHSDDVVRRFLREDGNNEKMLSTDVIVAIAKHYNTSIDEMLDRSSSSTKRQELGKEATKIPNNILQEAKNIGKSVSGTITAADQKPVKPHKHITKKPSITPTGGM
ncbi:MAG: helix-turn-helix transcriptional regulator [Candidatus Rickettsia vulgarisii]